MNFEQTELVVREVEQWAKSPASRRRRSAPGSTFDAPRRCFGEGRRHRQDRARATRAGRMTRGSSRTWALAWANSEHRRRGARVSSSSATHEGRSSSGSPFSRSRCRPASGTIGGRQTRLAPDGSGGWPAERVLRAQLSYLEQKLARSTRQPELERRAAPPLLDATRLPEGGHWLERVEAA